MALSIYTLKIEKKRKYPSSQKSLVIRQLLNFTSFSPIGVSSFLRSSEAVAVTLPEHHKSSCYSQLFYRDNILEEGYVITKNPILKGPADISEKVPWDDMEREVAGGDGKSNH